MSNEHLQAKMTPLVIPLSAWQQFGPTRLQLLRLSFLRPAMLLVGVPAVVCVRSLHHAQCQAVPHMHDGIW